MTGDIFDRVLPIALICAWIAVGTELLYSPKQEVETSLGITKLTLETIKSGDPDFRNIPEVAERMKDAEEDIADPSILSFVAWLKWILLLFLVLAGLWSAFFLLRGWRHARMAVAVVSVLFLIRQLLRSHVIYGMLIVGNNPFGPIWKLGKREWIASMVWWDFLLPLFFIFVAICMFVGIVNRRGPSAGHI